MSGESDAIQPEMIDEKVMIPDLLLAAPAARPVLDRYGLRGCGGESGPMESLEFFARAHDVPIDRLLQEIREALTSGAPPEAPPAEQGDQLADTIYMPFFKSGIVLVLTLGALWGAYLLLRIGFLGSFTAVRLHDVNAHGHAQIFGWVGLFVMGFAYQAFPRFKHTSLPHPRLAYATLWMMLAGIICRSLLEPIAPTFPALGTPVVGAAVLEIFAIAVFVWLILKTLRISGKPLEYYDYYIISSLVWFVIQAVYGTLYLRATLIAPGREELLGLVATWQGPMREIQIHGFAMLMIFGVSQRIFHNFYSLPAPSQRKSIAAVIWINTAIVGEVCGLVAMRTSGHAWAGLWYTSVLLLVGSATMLVWDWHIFSQAHEVDRSLKFLRAAYVWLFISFGMLVLLPAYQYGLLPIMAPESAAADMGFSHAYYGAMRHAITVGFISLMIVGVAAKIVPTLKGVDVRALSPLWAPFILINVGCFIRVGFQTLTDLTGAAFPIAGISGLLEVTGLAIWGVHLWLIMSGRARVRPVTETVGISVPLAAGSPITPNHLVGEVLDKYPALLDTFIACGFTSLKNPLLRKTVARGITIESACRRLGADKEEFVKTLNERRADAGGYQESPQPT